VVRGPDGDGLVIADIPGLIEGAHQGAGLGHDFLRHVERTGVLLFVLDTAETEGRDVVDDFRVLNGELEQYKPELVRRPRLVAANKMDLPGADRNLEKLRQALPDEEILPISAVTGHGLDKLLNRLFHLVKTSPVEEPVAPVVHRYQAEEPFRIQKTEGVFVVSGARVEKLVAMTDLDNEEALQRFQHSIEKMGLEAALQQHGIQEGDVVKIGDIEFEYLL